MIGVVNTTFWKLGRPLQSTRICMMFVVHDKSVFLFYTPNVRELCLRALAPLK
jgi:hypothetical protein